VRCRLKDETSSERNLARFCPCFQNQAVLSLGGDDPASNFIRDRDGAFGPAIGCPLTDRRATENYFTLGAIANLYENVPLQLSHYQPLIDLIPSFLKYDNGTIAAQMDRADIADTHVGQAIEGFLRR